MCSIQHLISELVNQNIALRGCITSVCYAKCRLSFTLTLLGVKLIARIANLRQLQLQAAPDSKFDVQGSLQQGVKQCAQGSSEQC
jgi:hypothetical protein